MNKQINSFNFFNFRNLLLIILSFIFIILSSITLINQRSNNVTVTYGRIGIMNPHQIVKEFDSKDSAITFALKKIGEKQAKGYLQK